MSAETRFLVFAIERYRCRRGLTGREVADLFEAHGVYRLVRDNCFPYHIESPDHMIDEIDRRIAEGA